MWNGKFSIYKNHVLFRGCSQCKVIMLEVKLLGRFKVFSRDSFIKKKKIYFLWKVSSHKVQNGRI